MNDNRFRFKYNIGKRKIKKLPRTTRLLLIYVLFPLKNEAEYNHQFQWN
jgi:hypothetical protein